MAAIPHPDLGDHSLHHSLALRQRSVCASSGPVMFERFTAVATSGLWYYHSLVDAFRGYPSRIAGELERVVAEIEVAAFAR